MLKQVAHTATAAPLWVKIQPYIYLERRVSVAGSRMR
jgi:hypothetical protein